MFNFSTKNPYKELGNADSLVEHREDLDKLDSQKQRDFATRLILDCPPHEFQGFRHIVRAVVHPQQKESFGQTLSRAYEASALVYALTDLRNPDPAQTFIRDFNPDLCAEFEVLCSTLVGKNEDEIITRLLTTCQDHNALVRKAKLCFPESTFAQKMTQGAEVCQQIQLLLSDQPQQFFDDRSFNSELHTKFRGLFVHYLNDKQIGAHLARHIPAENKPHILIQAQRSLPPALYSQVEKSFQLRQASIMGLFYPSGQASRDTSAEKHPDNQSRVFEI